jgi:light-regulated signal transduction histidine kinase (bacteriophytochrome)
MMMDREQHKQVNEAAEKFAEAIKESYQALADRSVSAHELNAQLTQEFFNGVINNLRTQAENNRALAEDLIAQQRKQQEASQALTQESVGAYMDFLNSMFSFVQRIHGKEHGRNRGTRETLRAGSPREKKHGRNRSTRGMRGAGSKEELRELRHSPASWRVGT